MSTYSENIYIHQNFNKNQIKSVLLENATYSTRPIPTKGTDKGLLYFDTEINRIIVWNGNEWKIVKYFDDRDLNNIEDIQIRDIWADSVQVSMLTEDEAKGVTGSANQSVVQYYPNRPIKRIPGSWSFYTDEMRNVIFPKKFTDGGRPYDDFYRPIIKDEAGCTISDTEYMINEYNSRKGDISSTQSISYEVQYRIEFKDGRRMNATSPPNILPYSVTFYKYVGDKLTINYVGGALNKNRYSGGSPDFPESPIDSGKYIRNLMGTNIKKETDIVLLSVNGQVLSPYDHYRVSGTGSSYSLIIDTTTQSGTGWKEEGGLTYSDYIYIVSENKE